MSYIEPDKFDKNKQRCSGCNYYRAIDSKHGRCQLDKQSTNDKTVSREFYCGRYVGVYIGTG